MQIVNCSGPAGRVRRYSTLMRNQMNDQRKNDINDNAIEIRRWASHDISVFGDSAGLQRCIDFCWEIKGVFEQKCRLVVAEPLGTRGTSLGHPGSEG
jgi:hypothetical protein